jgi:hypothetical protein
MPTSAAMLSNKPSSAYGDPLGGAYTTAKNNNAAPEHWNYNHNLVPCVRIYCTSSPLRYALTIKPGWKWNYDVGVV